jgi:hypothetical protein
VSTVQRHSEEELRQQWAFLDALVDRQAASLKAGVQDPEEEDPAALTPGADSQYLEEISVLTHRVTSLESERAGLLRRLDLAEQARVAAEDARAEAEAARVEAESALAAARLRTQPAPPSPPKEAVPAAAAPAVAPPPKPAALGNAPRRPRHRSWWRRVRD